MMTCRSYLWGVFLWMLSLNNVVGYDGVTAVGETGKQIVEIVRSAHQDAGFSGAVLAAKEGKLIAAVAVGKSGDDPLKVTTLFEIASCTKPFTAIAVLKLVEQGRLGLDDSIADHLPGIPESCRGITVRHLLQHTSGIPGTNTRGSGKDLAGVLPTFLEGGPQSKPGERHEYWNQGYALLSEVIAQASGKSYVRYCRNEIFKPCQMKDSRFTGDQPPKGIGVSIGQSMEGRNRSALEHPYGEYGFQYRGMGGIVTNLVDLWRWDRTLAAGNLLNKESIAEMTRPGPGGYALGWRVKKIEPGRIVHDHTGGVRGFLTLIRRDPTTDSCLFVLSNSDASLPFRLVCTVCESALNGKKPSIAFPTRVEPKLVETLIGVYRDSRGRTLTVSREGAFTRAWIDWGGPVTRGYLSASKSGGLILGMITPNPFKFEQTNNLAVERDEKGEVKAITIVDMEPPLSFTRVADGEQK